MKTLEDHQGIFTMPRFSDCASDIRDREVQIIETDCHL